MNLNLPVKITKKEFLRLGEYAESCGYPLKTDRSEDFIMYTIDHPNYEITPFASGVFSAESNRWTYYIYIRL